MLALSLSLLAALTASAGPEGASDRNDGQAAAPSASHAFPSRLYVHNAVALPFIAGARPDVGLVADFNASPRKVGLELELDLRCAQQRATKHRWYVRCAVEQAAVRSSPMPGDERAAEVVATEIRDKLLVSSFDLRVDAAGRVRDVALRGGQLRPQDNRRIRRTRELIRAFVMRSFAGLDFGLRPIGPGEAVWSDKTRLLTQIPTHGMSLATGRVWHQTLDGDEGVRFVRSDGAAVIEPVYASATGIRENLRVDIEAWSMHAPTSGALLGRAWRAEGWPTASSFSSERGVGRPYLQAGVLLVVDPEDTVQVGPTGLTPLNLAWMLTPLPDAPALVMDAPR